MHECGTCGDTALVITSGVGSTVWRITCDYGHEWTLDPSSEVIIRVDTTAPLKVRELEQALAEYDAVAKEYPGIQF